jgi:hypothetical protein
MDWRLFYFPGRWLTELVYPAARSRRSITRSPCIHNYSDMSVPSHASWAVPCTHFMLRSLSETLLFVEPCDEQEQSTCTKSVMVIISSTDGRGVADQVCDTWNSCARGDVTGFCCYKWFGLPGPPARWALHHHAVFLQRSSYIWVLIESWNFSYGCRWSHRLKKAQECGWHKWASNSSKVVTKCIFQTDWRIKEPLASLYVWLVACIKFLRSQGSPLGRRFGLCCGFCLVNYQG